MVAKNCKSERCAVLPLVLLADKSTRNNAGTVGLMYFETMSLNVAITNLTKNLFKRKRPFVYGDLASMEKKMEVDSRKSFFSGHTSVAASMSFFTAKVITDFHPNSKYNSVVWIGAATIPAVMAYLRVAAGKHFFTDVIVGYLVGGAIGILVPQLHKKENLEIGQGLNNQNVPLVHFTLRF